MNNIRDLDYWLSKVDYGTINSSAFLPSPFALTFMNFIKLVNGEQGEANKTPPVHLMMLDKLASNNKYVANLCFRGSGKTTLFGEYLILYLAIFNHIPNLGNVDGAMYISDSMENGAKSLRKNIEYRFNHSEFLQAWIPEAKFTDPYLEFKNKEGRELGVRLYGAKTGLRGTKIFGKRPKLAILDDLVSDDDSKSKTSMEAIKDTVYKGVLHALDPNTRKVVFNGTPFNKQDILIEAVESGAWDVNVWPVCETFPCTPKEFKGAWEDRFPYTFVREQYELALKSGKISSFNQELMLRITSEESRLVKDDNIRWYSAPNLMSNRDNFNFYITTDFAVSSKQSADDSVISVWAYNANGDWFWVDGVCKKQAIDVTINDLFRLVAAYKPQQVGIETSGQQGAFITLLQNEMMNRNIWFNFASSNRSGTPGIRPVQDKLTRFNTVVPWFIAGKMYFPEELKSSDIMGTFMQEIRSATVDGLKSTDNCLDTISMLAYMTPWKPSSGPNSSETIDWDKGMWEDENIMNQDAGLSAYIV